MVRPPSRQNSTLNRRPATMTPNFVMGLAIQIARRYFFVETAKKAIGLMGFIFLLSVAASFVSFDDTYYIVQKQSVFNQYGVKLGWFWTCVVVGPFIWFSAKVHTRFVDRDRDLPMIGLMRLLVATVLWYICVQLFHRVFLATSHCSKGITWSRDRCSKEAGTWIPGFDISGHCFLLLYSLLIMSEEATAFRQWHQATSPPETETATEKVERLKEQKWTEYAFVAMMVLSIIWIKQLAISALYYHTLPDKICGALVAVLCWFVTYKMAFLVGVLQPPICRVKGKDIKV